MVRANPMALSDFIHPRSRLKAFRHNLRLLFIRPFARTTTDARYRSEKLRHTLHGDTPKSINMKISSQNAIHAATCDQNSAYNSVTRCGAIAQPNCTLLISLTDFWKRISAKVHKIPV